jgi:hypothetical protein
MAKDDLNPRAGKRTVEFPYETVLKKADPDFYKDRKREVEYEFAGGRRRFTADPTKRGAYKTNT